MTTEYTGSEAPLGQTKVTDFVTEILDAPTEAYEVEVEWRQPGGTVIETDKLSTSGVYRPAGSTESNDPGHYRAKRLIDAGETVTTGYTAYIRWKESSGASFTPWLLVESYSVIASDRTVQLGSTSLCSAQDVKDRLANIQGLGLPDGLTDTRLNSIIDSVNREALAVFGATSIGELTQQQQVNGRDACILLCIGEVLLSFFPMAEGVMRTAKDYRKIAYEKIDKNPRAPQHVSSGFGMGVQ